MTVSLHVVENMERNLSLLADEAWLREQYITHVRTTPDIAAEIGCSQAAVWYRLDKFSIPRRRPGTYARPTPAYVPQRHRGTGFRIDADGRECSACGLYQDWEQYHLSKPSQPGGRMSRCVTCWSEPRKGKRNGEYRAWALKRMGITAEEYDWLLALQDGVCAIHKGPETGQGAVYFSVDHDHACCPPKKSGQTHCCKKCIRGLLCRNCNLMVGLAEKVGQAWRFAEYLPRRPFMDKVGLRPLLVEGGDAHAALL